MAQQAKGIKVQDTLEYQQKRIQIIKEINANKVDIDRNCFKHSIAEKTQLKKDKKSFKGNSKEFKDYLVTKIITSMPTWGSMNLILN